MSDRQQQLITFEWADGYRDQLPLRPPLQPRTSRLFRERPDQPGPPAWKVEYVAGDRLHHFLLVDGRYREQL